MVIVHALPRRAIGRTDDAVAAAAPATPLYATAVEERGIGTRRTDGAR